MVVDYESIQPIEIMTISGDVAEVAIIVGLKCVDPGYEPFSYWEGDPGWGPEFDISYIALQNTEGKSREFGNFALMEDIFKNLLGESVYDAVIDAAMDDACENWEGYSEE